MAQILPEAAKQRVGDVMTTDVITVSPQATVSQIAQLMVDHHISGMPVIDADGDVTGVVTEFDMIMKNTHFKMPAFINILDMVIYFERPKHYEQRLNHILGTTAAEIMTAPAITIAPSATIEELAELMVERRKNPIPVVENGKLVGIISRSDIVQLMAREFSPHSDDTGDEVDEEA